MRGPFGAVDKRASRLCHDHDGCRRDVNAGICSHGLAKEAARRGGRRRDCEMTLQCNCSPCNQRAVPLSPIKSETSVYSYRVPDSWQRWATVHVFMAASFDAAPATSSTLSQLFSSKMR